MKRIYYAVPAAVVFLCAVLALVVRFSTTNLVNNETLLDFSVGLSDTFTDPKGVYDGGIPSSAEEAEEMADLVVRARFGGERMVAEVGLYSKVEVQEVYKGSEQWKGQSLWVLEEMSVFTQTQYLNTHGMYLPMQEQCDYLLLLKPVVFHPERRLTEMQKLEYYPVTQSPLSAFRISTERQSVLFGEEDVMVPLRELQGLDLATRRQTDLDIFYRLRDDLFQRYRITP